MAISVDISQAEMLSPNVNYSTQNLRASFPGQKGGRNLSNYGQNVGVLKSGIGFWSGTLGIAQSDRAGRLDTGKVESILIRIQNHTKTFACPIIRDTDKNISFRGVRNSQPVDLDNDLFEDYLTATTVGSTATDGSVTISYSINLKTADPTLSNIVAIIPEGCYISINGLLFLTTKLNNTTTLSGLYPNKDLTRLAIGEKIDWKNPWIAARVTPGFSIEMMRIGAMAGPWSINWEEAG